MKVAFTGSRASKLAGYDANHYESFKAEMAMQLEALYQLGYNEFISGGAQGFDQLAFWCVDELKKKHPEVRNIVHIPFRGQERQWRTIGLFGQNEYKAMLNKADEVVYLQDELFEKREIVNALMERNHSMVNASDLVVALYANDDWKTASGGTAECMRYASNANKEIYQIRWTLRNGDLHII